MNHDGYKCYDSEGGVQEIDLSSMPLPDGWFMELKYFTDCLRSGIKPDRYQTLESIADTYRILRAERESVLTGKPITIK